MAHETTAASMIEATIDQSAEPLYEWLEDLYRRPELLQAPVAVVPRLAWAGRVTLLVGKEKGGKSTIAGQAVAARVASRPFLGDRPLSGPVLWLCLDEAKADLVRRLERYGAEGRVAISQQHVTVAQLEQLIGETKAGLVVIDTLVELFAGLIEDPYNAHHWQQPLAALREIAQRTGVAVVLLHHTTRAGDRYADSRQIGAGVDQIVTMTEVAGDPTLREVESRGRVVFERYRIRFVADAYELLDQGELPLFMRVYQVIKAEPGIGSGKLRKLVRGKAAAVDATIRELLEQRAIEDRGNGGGHAFFALPRDCGTEPEQARDNHDGDVLSPLGQPGSTPGQASGQPGLSRSHRESAGQPLQAGAEPRRGCRWHPASELEISPLTGEFACRSCTPGLFPELPEQVEGGLATATQP